MLSLFQIMLYLFESLSISCLILLTNVINYGSLFHVDGCCMTCKFDHTFMVLTFTSEY